MRRGDVDRTTVGDEVYRVVTVVNIPLLKILDPLDLLKDRFILNIPSLYDKVKE